MNFATIRIRDEWTSEKLSPILRQIVREAYFYAMDRWAWRFFVTCIYRTPEEDEELEGTGVHPAWRAMDIRTRDQSLDAIQDVTDFVNRNWIYDPSRPRLVPLYSKPHGSGPHLHFQAHPLTVRRA